MLELEQVLELEQLLLLVVVLELLRLQALGGWLLLPLLSTQGLS